MRALEAVVVLHPVNHQSASVTNSIAVAEWWSRGGHNDDFAMAMQQQRLLDEDATVCESLPIVPDAVRLRRSARPLFRTMDNHRFPSGATFP